MPTPLDPLAEVRAANAARRAAAAADEVAHLKPTAPPRSPVAVGPSDEPDALAWCLSQHTARRPCPPSGGGRNAWLAALSIFCNERGVPLADLLTWAESAPELAGHNDGKPNRIRDTITRLYREGAAAHGCNLYTAPRAPRDRTKPDNPARAREGPNEKALGTTAVYCPETSPPDGEPVPETPLIPPSVYAALPVFLQRCCEPFDGRKRDVLLTGALTVLSGCFPTLSGIYDGERFGANLFSFTVAPAASGKGALKWARALAHPHHRTLVQASKQARAEFEAEADAHRAQVQAARKSGVPPGPAPEQPPYRQLLIPANSSAALVVQALAQNDGRGIICEPEADTLAEALKQEWGNFSDLLRVAFDHAPYTAQRKGGEHHEIERPALSVALTGTPAQVGRLIPTAENGLFSRFLFYTFDAVAEWRDVSPTGTPVPFDAHFTPLADTVTRMIHVTATAEIRVGLTPAQWTRVNAAGRDGLADVLAQAEGDAAGVAFRLSLSGFRVVLLLTLLRAFENGEAPAGVLTCEDADLTTALTLADVYRAHALAMLARMPRPDTAPRRWGGKADKETRVRELHAQGASLREIEAQTGVARSTAERWLS